MNNKLKKMKKSISLLIAACFLFFSCNAQNMKSTETNSDKANLEIFLKKLIAGNSTNTELYNNSFFINDSGKPNRDMIGIKYYTDTLFKEIKDFSINGFNVYSLKDARTKFKKENLYNYYYDGQKDAIYIIFAQSGKEQIFYYSLMYNGKIVSLMPTRILDDSIIGWK